MMKGYITSSFFILLFACVAFAQPGSEYAKGSFYFKLKDLSSIATNSSFNATYTENGVSVSPITPVLPAWQQIIAKYKANSLIHPFPQGGEATKNVYEVNFNESVDLDQVMSELINSGTVEYTDRVPYFKLSATPSDLPSNSTTNQYFERIKINMAWSYQNASIKPVIIAVIDGPIQVFHEDLIGNLWTNPKETPNNNADEDENGIRDDYYGADVGDGDGNTEPLVFANPTDDDIDFGNHGTIVSGIAGATTDNNLGSPSLGFNARLMAIKSTKDGDPFNSLTGGINGIYYAINKGADIINISWGIHDDNRFLKDAIKAAANAKIIVVAAAGNLNNDAPFYPAAYDGVIAVGASYIHNDDRWVDTKSGDGSNYGTYIDVMAPGVNIQSCLAFAGDKSPSKSSYGTETGTSMSSPLVAGFASLILSLKPNLSPAEVEDIIKKGCDPIEGNFFLSGKLGAGRINVDKSLELLLSTGKATTPHTSVNIYPNPSNGTFYVSFQGEAMNKYSISVCDLQGREVFSESGFKSAEDLQIQIPQMETGLYLVRLQTGDKSLLVQRISVY